jgi:aminopeptidase N
LADGSDYLLDQEDKKTLTIFYKTIAKHVNGLEDRSSSFWSSPSNSVFSLSLVVESNPSTNTALSGLYKSDDMLCTQCEAMGFRRITFHLDRPDVLSVYSVRLEADKGLYPILLSNGNCIQKEDLPNNRHVSVWHDPFPKPSYLFAIVAGDLGFIKSTYTTRPSGRVVEIGIYSEKSNASKLDFAMYSIKESMKWDEDTFGLEYDLDTFNIVGVTNFNMGAMENKGLNIFLASLIVADKDTATDEYYGAILAVIAHE